MPRPKKKKNNMEELSQQVLEAVTDAYLNPTEDTADENGKMSLNVLADEFSMSRIKLRKLLITAGVYETQISLKVNELYNSGKTIKEIQTITGLSAASVSGYLPYQKTIYNLEESTLVAERLRKYRNRKAAVHQLATAIEDGDLGNIKETLWNALVTFEEYPFKTAMQTEEKTLYQLDGVMIGKRIKRVRKARGLTQERLAERCDCTSTHISNIENGKIGISIELLYTLSRVLDQKMDFFLMDSEGADPNVKINSVIAPKLEQCDPEMLDVIDGFLDRMITYRDKLTKKFETENK